MAHAENEVEDMVAYAGSLMLTIGTLTDSWVASMIKAGERATALQKPIIFDPVGSGVTPFRTASAKAIIDKTKISVIRRNASKILSIANGHPLMPYVTGTGCSATAVIGAFAAMDTDYLTAAATGMVFFGLAGEIAGKAANGPGSFMIHLLDALYTMTPEQLETGCRIQEG